jgi:hypothetical protein
MLSFKIEGEIKLKDKYKLSKFIASKPALPVFSKRRAQERTKFIRGIDEEMRFRKE